jgi:hypothetical protein
MASLRDKTRPPYVTATRLVWACVLSSLALICVTGAIAAIGEMGEPGGSDLANGYSAIGLAGGAIILFAVAGVLVSPAMRWIPRGGCEHCGYDLKGVRGERCPECGYDIPRVRRNAE